MAEKKTNPIKKFVTFCLFALLIASFGVWGIGDIFQGPTHAYSVAQVGKVSIGQQEFSRNLRQELARLAPQFGGRLDIEQAQAFGVVQQVMDRLTTRALYEQHADDLGLIVTDDQLREQIVTLPAFQGQNGRFDRFAYEGALRSSGLTEEAFLLGLSGDIQRQQVVNAISGAASMPRAMAETLYRYSAETRSADTVTFRNDSIAELADPDEGQIKKYYDEQSSDFLAPAYRSLNVLQISPSALTDEVAVSDERLQQEYELRIDAYSVPERRNVSQVLYPSEQEAKDALAMIREGKSFEAVVSETSAGTPVALGLISRAELAAQLPALADGAFAAEEGGVSEPVQSPLGWHLAQVTEVQAGSVSPLEEVVDDLRTTLQLSLATDTAIELANALDDTMAGGQTLEEAASTLGLKLERFARVDRSGNDENGERIEALPDDRTFINTAFSTDIGQESLLTETAEGGYFVVQVLSSAPAAARPLDEVRDDVIAGWKAAERTRLLSEKAQAMVDAINLGGDFAALAEEAGLTLTNTPALRRFNTNPTAGIPLELPTKLFELDEGKADIVEDTEGVMVARLSEITAAPEAEADNAIETLQTNLANRIQGDLVSQFTTTLNSTYSVEINNRNLDTVLSQF